MTLLAGHSSCIQPDRRGGIIIEKNKTAHLAGTVHEMQQHNLIVVREIINSCFIGVFSVVIVVVVVVVVRALFSKQS